MVAQCGALDALGVAAVFVQRGDVFALLFGDVLLHFAEAVEDHFSLLIGLLVGSVVGG